MTIGKWWQPSKLSGQQGSSPGCIGPSEWMLSSGVWSIFEQNVLFPLEVPLLFHETKLILPFLVGFPLRAPPLLLLYLLNEVSLVCQIDLPLTAERRQHIQERPKELVNGQIVVLGQMLLGCSQGITVFSLPHPWASSRSLPCQSPLCLFVLSCSCQLQDERQKDANGRNKDLVSFCNGDVLCLGYNLKSVKCNCLFGIWYIQNLSNHPFRCFVFNAFWLVEKERLLRPSLWSIVS